MTDQVRPVPEFDAAGLAKDLLRTLRSGALATLEAETGTPFASLVTVATDHDGSPLLLLSRLAAHTQHLERNPRASILLSQTGKGDPLAHPRLTVIGRALRSAEPRVRSRFLSRHPKAELYAGFADFSFWRMDVERAHLNGGFARAATLTASELMTDVAGAQDLLDDEAQVLRGLRAEHPDAPALLAIGLAGARPGPWIATGLDPEGLDLAAGERTARVPFPNRVISQSSFRETLAEFIRRARARAASASNATGT
jgi:putative heme iron utilization protein